MSDLALDEQAVAASGMSDEDQVKRVTRRLETCKPSHDQFVRKFERMDRAYRGIVNPSDKAAGWRNISNPRIGFQMIETVVANTIEEGLLLRCVPSPKPGMSLEEAQSMLLQVEAAEDLIRAEHRLDDMDEKQRPLFLSDAICGIGIISERWAYNTGITQKQVVVHDPVHDPSTGVEIGHVPRVEMQATEELVRDHSTAEIVDPRDFMIHPSARNLQPRQQGGAQYVINRVWYSMQQLREYERGGYMRNVDKLGESRDQTTEHSDRERMLYNIDRGKDLIECLELWEYAEGAIWRTIVGNRKVLLSPRQLSPFEHGEYPFIATSSMPQLFTMRGMGTMELIESLQQMLWTLQSQRMDNIELINNAILLIRADIDDPEAFEWFPGARWPVQAPTDVQTFQPPYQLASLTLEAENVLKSDLQSVTSAAPLAGGVSEGSNNPTATGTSIVMSNAQKALQARKYQCMKGLVREAEMRLKNIQQFGTDKRLLHVLGASGESIFKEIDPLKILGRFDWGWDASTESMNRQEKRAEATQWLQVVSGLAPMMAATQQPLDLKELVLWAAKRWNITDAERFFSQQPAALGAAAGPGGPDSAPTPGPSNTVNTGNVDGAPPQPNLGVTAGSAVDSSSPSATGGVSASPSVFMQRALAMSGGSNNRGGR